MKARTYFADIFQKPGNRPIFCYRSGLTVYEEGLDAGMFASLGWNGAGFTQDILDGVTTYLNANNFPHAEIFRVDANGVSLTYSWQLAGFDVTKEADSVHAVMTLTSSRAPLTAKVHTVADGTAIFMRWLEFTNTGDGAVNLSNITIMGGGMESMERWHDYINEDQLHKLYSVGYFEHNQWGAEGGFRWHDIGTARMTIASHYQKNRFRHPMFIVKNNALGTIWFGQLGYSGGWAFDIDVNTNNRVDAAHLSFAARMDGENPTYVMQPGERIETPKLHIGMMNGDLDDIINEMHAHTRKSVFTLPAARGVNGGWIEGGMGPEHLMTVELTRHFVDTLAAVGAETMIIDAGWYCPPGRECREWHPLCGDWEYDPDRYPNGLEEIRDYIHEKGLLFGLWASIEEAGANTKVAKEHPGWFTTAYHGGKKTDLLDLTKPEVVEHLEKVFAHLVEDYKIDLFRIDLNIGDYNVNFIDDRGENGTARYYDSFYALLRRLRERYPDVVFENCAGGGGRTDLGMVANFTHTWVSDWQVAPRSVQITNGMTMVLPPEMVDRLSSGMNSHKTGTLDMNIRHTLFGRPSTNNYNCMGTEMNPNQIDFVRHSFDIYKEVIRPFAPTGKIFHHTPEAYDFQTKGTIVLERSAEDGSAGVIGIFRMCGTNADETVLYPRGIDVGAAYEVTFDNSGATAKISGYDMANNGLRVRIGQNLSSELIIYKKA
ncbi:MAG: alpha-galactosidase [Clostridia bacterium]|nr:alpha-galactosidase [Clostridia bacterium]